MEDVVSAPALKGTEERVPGDENSKTKGTETGKPGTPSSNDDSRWTSAGNKEGTGPYLVICNVRVGTCTLFRGPGELLKASEWLEIRITMHLQDGWGCASMHRGKWGCREGEESAAKIVQARENPGQRWLEG